MDFVGLEKLSLVDYDNKLSCVLFMQGCNFRCPFCHNSQLVLNDNVVIPFKDIMDYLKLRRNVLDGVVISGGEPTLMPDLIDKIKEIKALGYLVKLDTNGTNPDVVQKLIDLKLVDHFAMDIKNYIDDYEPITGVKNIYKDRVLKTISILINSGVSYEFRTTLVKEFHNENNIKKMGEMLKGAKKMYLQHFVDNKDCIVHNLHDISIQEATNYKQILSNYIDFVELRGY